MPKISLHLLLTPDIAATKPSTTAIIRDYGQLTVIFGNNIETRKTGLHCVVEDTRANLIAWLKPFDGFVKGSGIPQFEQFEIVHIKESNLN